MVSPPSCVRSSTAPEDDPPPSGGAGSAGGWRVSGSATHPTCPGVRVKKKKKKKKKKKTRRRPHLPRGARRRPALARLGLGFRV